MTGLIKWLLQDNVRADKIAQRLYSKAARRAERRQKKDCLTPSLRIIDADSVAAELEGLLLKECSQLNCLDARQYQAVFKAVYHWNPHYSPEQSYALQRCGLVQNGLLALLPQLQQKQQLEKLCRNYQVHLAQAAAGQPKKPPVTGGTLRLFASPPLPTHTRGVSPPLPRQSAPSQADDSLSRIREKQIAVRQLQQTWKTRKPLDDQRRDFQHVFQQQRPLLEKSRDSAGTLFLKAVATVLSLTVAAWMGIWAVKGQKTTQQIQEALREPPSPGA